uniref:BZIP domain-containing protein n=1 Tax=Cuerna arida TaxID=1464854 RepID=A0A1B6GLH4_9HEMI
MSASSINSWKQEPESPLFQFEQDYWFGGNDNVVVEVELTDEVKVSRAEHASKLLRDLDEQVKEEEPFPDWLEEKIDLPIFDDLPPPPQLMNMDVMGLKPTAPSINSLDMLGLKPAPINNCNLNMVPIKQLPPVNNNNMGIEAISIKQQPQTILPANPLQYQIPSPNLQMDQTPVLMQEFDYLSAPQHHNTLTPPESPREAELVFTMLQEMQPHELDELVRMRVESLVESPADTSCSSLHEESESVASPSSESGYSDPEWTIPSCSSPDLKVSKRRRVSKPYARTPPEEKRLRKKEQNKNAATRYRLKKKQEIEEILGEEKELQQRNEGLKSELVEVRREIKYLKNLMRDMFRAKGLMK